jgi:hypothetical protein
MPPSTTKTIENLTSNIMTFAILMLVVAAIAALLARQFGGSSRRARQAIFSIVSFIGVCGVAFYMIPRLSGGG